MEKRIVVAGCRNYEEIKQYINYCKLDIVNAIMLDTELLSEHELENNLNITRLLLKIT